VCVTISNPSRSGPVFKPPFIWVTTRSKPQFGGWPSWSFVAVSTPGQVPCTPFLALHLRRFQNTWCGRKV